MHICMFKKFPGTIFFRKSETSTRHQQMGHLF